MNYNGLVASLENDFPIEILLIQRAITSSNVSEFLWPWMDACMHLIFSMHPSENYMKSFMFLILYFILSMHVIYNR